MSSGETTPNSGLTQHESIDLVASALRFYRSLLRRKWVVIGVTCCTLTLAAFYYITATRLYESKAELIFLNTGGNVLQEGGSDVKELTSQMPNYERVMQGDKVLKAALKTLSEEHLGDFVDTEPEMWLEQFRKRMTVSTLRNTNSMTVSFRSISPSSAFVIVDQLLMAYLAEMNSLHQGQVEELLRILEQDRTKSEMEIRSMESELERLKNESQVLFNAADEPTNILADRVRELNTAYVNAKKLALDSQALMNAVVTAYQRGEDLQPFVQQFDPGLASNLFGAHMGVGGQDAFLSARIQQDLLDDQAELNNLMETHGPNHPLVKELTARIGSTAQFLQAQRQSASLQLAELSARELGPRLTEMAQRRYQYHAYAEQQAYQAFQIAQQEALKIESQLNHIAVLTGNLTRARESYAKVMEVIDSQSLSKESGVQVSIISPPKPDHRPVTPKLASTVMMGLMMGLAMSCLIVYILDFVDDRFHSPDDLRQTLGTPILAMIRKLPQLAPNGLESLYPYAKPNSVESEAFRTLRTTIDFHPDGLRRITISSTEPSDGKTTVMASLGVAFAQSGKRTLMIDGDMRRPGLTRLFNLTSSPGLSNILKDEQPAWDVAGKYVVHTNLKGLDVIPAGPRPVNPVELLTGDRLAELIGWAEQNYDQLLIDAPPSLAVADVQVIGRLVDAALLTVRPDKNKRKMVIRAAEALTVLGCNLLGIVVNHVEPKSGTDYAYGYGYGYGYGEGYGHDDHHHGEQSGPGQHHQHPDKSVPAPGKKAA